MLTKSKDLKKDKQVKADFIKEKVKPLKWVGWSQQGAPLLLTGLLWGLPWERIEPEALLTEIHHEPNQREAPRSGVCRLNWGQSRSSHLSRQWPRVMVTLVYSLNLPYLLCRTLVK